MSPQTSQNTQYMEMSRNNSPWTELYQDEPTTPAGSHAAQPSQAAAEAEAERAFADALLVSFHQNS